jgi:hypothetical protein
MTKNLLILVVCPVLLAQKSAAAEAAVSSCGVTGIIVTNAESGLTVAYLLNNSPAGNSRQLHPGDRILAVTPDASKEVSLGTDGMSPASLSKLLMGSPDVPVSVTAVCGCNGAAPVTNTVTMRRAIPLTIDLGQLGKVAVFLNDENIVKRGPFVMPRDKNALRVTTPHNWRSLTVGMSKQDVLSAVGAPVKIAEGRSITELSWQYGWLVHIGGQTFDLSPAEILFKNGVIAEFSRIEDPYADNSGSVEIICGQ